MKSKPEPDAVETLEQEVERLRAKLAALEVAPTEPLPPRTDDDLVTQLAPAEWGGIRLGNDFSISGHVITPGHVNTAPWGAWKTFYELASNYAEVEKNRLLDRGAQINLGAV